MDLKMPNLDGIEATRQILAKYPSVKVLLLTTFEADNHVIQALKAGASGYILKDSRPDSIVSSLLAVMAGGRGIANAVGHPGLGMLNRAATPQEVFDGLTRREIEILKLLAGGLAKKQDAHKLKIHE